MEQMMDKTVLYVDDEPTNLQLFNLQYRKHFNVLTATSADKGLSIIEANPIDLVITDLKMPIMNGIDFIKEIKKSHPDLKCIILSGHIELKLIDEHERSLVNNFLIKPWKKEVVIETIQQTLGL